MPLRMRTRSAGRPVAESLGGGTGVRVGIGRRGRKPREGNAERVDELNGQGNNQGLGANGGAEKVNKNVEVANGGAPDFSTIIAQQLQNLLPAMLAQVSNRGNVGNQNGNVVNENVQENVGNVLVNGNRVGCSYKEFLACNPMEDNGFNMVELSDPHAKPEVAVKSELWNHVMVGAGHAAYTNRFYELARLVSHLVTPESRMIERKREYGYLVQDCRGVLRNVNHVNARNPTVRACYECGSTDHVRSVCPRLNRAQEPKGNRPNQVAANNGGQGRGNRGNQARGRAFMLGAKEVRQDPNIVTVEIDKVIKGCKLEIEGHVFDIDLIPFGHGSFDMIIGMDWLSNYKAKIICHEKVVRIPLPDGKVLRVVGERPEEKARLLMSAKASDKKQERIVLVRYFPEVFPDDLSGLPPITTVT
ncbi:putative reverse transcriptase domain-containing protein, partial [Tanacetum coccineum]